MGCRTQTAAKARLRAGYAAVQERFTMDSMASHQPIGLTVRAARRCRHRHVHVNLMCVMRAILFTLTAALLLTPASADAHHYHGRNAGGACLNVYRGDGVLGKPIPTACNTNFYGGDGD